jgi:hypothetical protein
MKQILGILILGLLVISCTKENSNEFFPYKNNELNDTLWYSPVPLAARVRQLDSIFTPPFKVDSVDVANGGVVNFGDSVQLIFPTSFCTGGPASGKVKIEVLHLKQKGDMVKADRPTMSYGSLLVTGGSINIRVSYNGQYLQLAPGKQVLVKIFNKMSNTNLSTGMEVFYGTDNAFPANAVQQFTWLPSQDTVSMTFTQTPGVSLSGYAFPINRFGWVNVDYFSDSTQPRTKAVVVLPPNFTNANTNVYAVVKSPDIVAQLYADPTTKTFVIPNIYVGKVVTFVSLSYIAGNLYLGYKEVTITTNMNINLAPTQTSKQNIDSFLDSL